MKKSFFLLLFYNSCFAQQQDHVKSLELVYKEFPKNSVCVEYAGYPFYYKEFEKLTDILLENIKSQPLFDSRESYYGSYYKNKSFKKILNEIDSLPITALDYHSNKRYQIYREIEGLPNSVMQVHAHYYFINHLLHQVRSDSLAQKIILEDKFQCRPDSNLYDVAEICEAAGDFYRQVYIFPTALEMYTECLSVYDSIKSIARRGSIEEKIAELYGGRPDESYIKKSVEHYTNAIKFYNESNNEPARILASVKKSENMVWPEYEPTISDLVYETGNLKKQNISVPNVWNYVIDNNLHERNKYILESVDFAMRHLSLFKANSEILSNTYRALRNYFDKSGDIESAKTYAFLTIIANIQFPVKNLKDIARDITDLAGIYSRSHNIDAARKYSDFAIELSKKAGNPYGEALRILDKAQCLIDNNLSNEALELSKKMFDLADTTSILGGDIITEYSSGLLSEIYGKLDSMRLANYYSSIYTSKRANLLKEYDLMSETDANYTEDKDATNIDHLNIELTEVNKHLAASMIKALELRKEIQLLNTQKEGLQTAAALIRNKNDSLLSQQKALNTTNSSLSKHNDTLTKENVRLDEDNALKKKRLRATFWWAAIILGSMLIITIIVTRIQRQRILTRDLKIEQERKKIIDTRAELSSLAKGKLHNVRGDYNSFIALILKSDFSTATLYAEKCAALFSLALDKWDWEKNAYTLADELATLNAFCETQKVLGKKIIIEPSFASDLNSDQILFMPEVFTTLLHNSIKHGLRDNDAALKFNIGVTRKDDFLFFEVSDNGIPSKIESYLKPEKPNKGLALLRRRIENILEGKKDQKKFEHKFEISINLGTTIKFIFPYESTIKNNNS